MEWFIWFGQTVAFILGAFSLLWIIGRGMLFVLKVLVRTEYNIESEQLDHRTDLQRCRCPGLRFRHTQQCLSNIRQ